MIVELEAQFDVNAKNASKNQFSHFSHYLFCTTIERGSPAVDFINIVLMCRFTRWKNSLSELQSIGVSFLFDFLEGCFWIVLCLETAKDGISQKVHSVEIFHESRFQVSPKLSVGFPLRTFYLTALMFRMFCLIEKRSILLLASSKTCYSANTENALAKNISHFSYYSPSKIVLLGFLHKGVHGTFFTVEIGSMEFVTGNICSR